MARCCLLLWLALTLGAASYHETQLGWRVNLREVTRSGAEFCDFLRTAGPESIRLLEFSGHGTRVCQSMDDYADKRTPNALWWTDGKWSLLGPDGREPDAQWAQNLKRALAPDAKVYFYGCQTGLYDTSGLVDKALADCIARAFSEEFQVTTIACPEIVYYPGHFPEFDGSPFSNPSIPPTEGFSTPGGVWNIFERGRWIPPLRPGEATTFKGLKRPRLAGS